METLTAVEKIQKELEQVRKEGDTTGRNILSVFLGEVQNSADKSDENITKIAVRIVKALDETNTEETKKERSYLEGYLPVLYTEERIQEILSDYKTDGVNTVAGFMGSFNHDYRGKADNRLVKQIAENLIGDI